MGFWFYYQNDFKIKTKQIEKKQELEPKSKDFDLLRFEANLKIQKNFSTDDEYSMDNNYLTSWWISWRYFDLDEMTSLAI